jgi:hypothetical protein
MYYLWCGKKNFLKKFKSCARVGSVKTTIYIKSFTTKKMENQEVEKKLDCLDSFDFAKKALLQYLITDLLNIVLDYSFDLLFERCVDSLTKQGLTIIPSHFLQFKKVQEEFFSNFEKVEVRTLDIILADLFYSQNTSFNCPHYFDSKKHMNKQNLYEINLWNNELNFDEIILLLQENKSTLRKLSIGGYDTIDNKKMTCDQATAFSRALLQCKFLRVLVWSIKDLLKDLPQNVLEILYNGILSHTSVEILTISCHQNIKPLFFNIKQLKTIYFTSNFKENDPLFDKKYWSSSNISEWAFSNKDEEDVVAQILEWNKNLKILLWLKPTPKIMNELIHSPQVEEVSFDINKKSEMDCFVSTFNQTRIQHVNLGLKNFTIDAEKLGYCLTNIKSLCIHSNALLLTTIDYNFLHTILPFLQTCEKIKISNVVFTFNELMLISQQLPRSLTELDIHTIAEETKEKKEAIISKNLENVYFFQNTTLFILETTITVPDLNFIYNFKALKHVSFRVEETIDFKFVQNIIKLVNECSNLERIYINSTKCQDFTETEILLLLKLWKETNSLCNVSTSNESDGLERIFNVSTANEYDGLTRIFSFV